MGAPSQSVGFVARGNTANLNLPVTLAWGTDGLLTLGYIVKSIRASDVNEVIYIENGTGIRCKRINLIQGREYEVTVEDDLNIAAPAINASLALIDPISWSNSKNVTVLDNNYNAARKQNGERVLKCVYDTLIEGQGNIP